MSRKNTDTILLFSVIDGKMPGGGVLTCSGIRECTAKMGYFFTKNPLDMGPILVKKFLRGEAHFTKL